MVGIRIESDLIADAVRELLRILAVLPARHGDAYRALERAIEALPDVEKLPKVYDLDWDGPTLILVAAPPAEMMALIREAERLGV